jgi:hypothetical protein
MHQESHAVSLSTADAHRPALAGLIPSLAELMSGHEACRVWPGRRGKPLNIAVYHRLAQKGSRGVKLRTVHVPSVGRCTCMAWIADFLREINAPAPAADPAPRGRVRRTLLRDQFTAGAKP